MMGMYIFVELTILFENVLFDYHNNQKQKYVNLSNNQENKMLGNLLSIQLMIDT